MEINDRSIFRIQLERSGTHPNWVVSIQIIPKLNINFRLFDLTNASKIIVRVTLYFSEMSFTSALLLMLKHHRSNIKEFEPFRYSLLFTNSTILSSKIKYFIFSVVKFLFLVFFYLFSLKNHTSFYLQMIVIYLFFLITELLVLFVF